MNEDQQTSKYTYCYSLDDHIHVDGLEKSWFGFYRDNTDAQWNAFSENFPIMIIFATIFTSTSKILKNKY